jgi:PKD repeat protein
MENDMTQKSRIFLGTACFLLLLLAANGWLTGKENVSRSPGLNSLSPRIAADSVGNFHVVWGEYVPNSTRGDAYYSKYDIGTQTWSAPINLSNNGRVFSEEKRPVGIAIDGSDNIYVIYVEKSAISLRIFSGGSWGAAFLLADWNSGDCDSARVAVDSLGNIFTCWWTLDSYVVHSRARVDGVWEDLRHISAGQSKFCDIAVGSNTVFACWTARHNTTVYQIFYTRRSTSLNADWTNPQLMYRGSHKQQVPAVEVGSNDIAHIAFTPAFEEAGMRIVRYCRWTGNGFAAPVPLSLQMVLHYPALDERDGNLYACWQVGAYGNGFRVDANNLIGGVWSGPKAVPDSAGSTYCDVAADPFGVSIYYVWDSGGEIWCNMGQTGSVPPDNEPPTADFSFSPTTGIYPIEITFDGSASEDPDGSIASYSWDFGDGGRDSGAVVKHTYNRWGTYAVTLVVRDNVGALDAKTSNIEILRLFQPLNIRWETKTDESLLQSRRVTQVTWSKNPANDALGVQISKYRVYRKKPGDSDAAYEFSGEVTGQVYKFLDANVGKNDVFVYTVTACDSQGHESPIVGGQSPSLDAEKRQELPAAVKRGGLAARR